jgi:hypothetical protein
MWEREPLFMEIGGNLKDLEEKKLIQNIQMSQHRRGKLQNALWLCRR